jgi:hypothetical protein
LAVVTAANISAASRILSLHLSLAVRSTTLLGQVVSRPLHLTSGLPNFTIAAPLSIRLCKRGQGGTWLGLWSWSTAKR